MPTVFQFPAGIDNAEMDLRRFASPQLYLLAGVHRAPALRPVLSIRLSFWTPRESKRIEHFRHLVASLSIAKTSGPQPCIFNTFQFSGHTRCTEPQGLARRIWPVGSCSVFL